MTNINRGKIKFLITVFVGIVALPLLVFNSEPCACLTVNDTVVWSLKAIEIVISEYAEQHNGIYPTIEKVKEIVGKKESRLSGEIDYESGSFLVQPVRGDAGNIGYATSPNRRDYILICVGVTEKRIGIGPLSILIDYELPILRSGDTPPEPSPIE